MLHILRFKVELQKLSNHRTDFLVASVLERRMPMHLLAPARAVTANLTPTTGFKLAIPFFLQAAIYALESNVSEALTYVFTEAGAW